MACFIRIWSSESPHCCVFYFAFIETICTSITSPKCNGPIIDNGVILQSQRYVKVDVFFRTFVSVLLYMMYIGRTLTDGRSQNGSSSSPSTIPPSHPHTHTHIPYAYSPSNGGRYFILQHISTLGNSPRQWQKAKGRIKEQTMLVDLKWIGLYLYLFRGLNYLRLQKIHTLAHHHHLTPTVLPYLQPIARHGLTLTSTDLKEMFVERFRP